MVTCTRRLEWDAMHRIPQHESKCRAYHGHRYVAEITCAAPELDALGRVVDFGVVKEAVGGWIEEHWDHTGILMRGDPEVGTLADVNERMGRPIFWVERHPTAETLVGLLAGVAQRLLADAGVVVVKIRLWETPNASAEWTAPSPP
jgi:6-pyruvoyltetrahydropterin/6-carboxytetrahydropterin synthase